jgi:hypothetical protein
VHGLALIEQNTPQFFTERGATRLARNADGDFALPQRCGKPGEVRALARTIYAFEGHEFAAHA